MMSLKRWFITGLACVSAICLAFSQDKGDSVQVHFRQNCTTLQLKFNSNSASLESVVDSLELHLADSTLRLRNIQVVGAASPEGSIPLNMRLSKGRAAALTKYLSARVALPSDRITYSYLGRDWAGLLELVKEDPNVPYREETIEMLSDIAKKAGHGENPKDDNIFKLKNLRFGEPWLYMYRNLFPKLRQASFLATYDPIWGPPPLIAIKDSIEVGTSLAGRSYVSECKTGFTPPYALKTNLLYDALLVPNIGIEFGLGTRWSLAANYMYAWWNSDRTHWYHRVYGGDLTLRYWPERNFDGHHIGLSAQALTYDFEFGNLGVLGGEPGGNIFDQANFSIGLEYGYSLPLADRFNLDFSLCAGYMWGKFYEYVPMDDCYVWQATKQRSYIGPVKAEISLVYLLDLPRKGGAR